MTENEIATETVDTTFPVHSRWRPKLRESFYEVILAHALTRRGLGVPRQGPNQLVYEKVDEGFEADLVVNQKFIVEIESVETTTSVHKKQLLTYLHLADKHPGLLVNFSGAPIKDGVTRASITWRRSAWTALRQTLFHDCP